MDGLSTGIDLLIVLVTAIVGGMLARWLRLPVILGYLAGGIIIGPFCFGWVHDSNTIDTLANIGVVLLLFAIGLEFSFKELLKIGKIAVLGGIAQIVLTAMAGFGLGRMVGLNVTGSVFFGFIIALSSTMVVLKLLIDRGEIDTVHGRIMLGILLVQDLSVVPIMVAMPAVAGELGGLWASLGITIAKAVGFIAGMLVVGYWILPWFLNRLAGQRSRELFFLTVVVVCLAAATGTYYFGLSAAFGAFTAGLLLGQSGFARQAFADILPLRDTFAAFFFVSLGLLANQEYFLSHIRTIVVIVAAVMLIKFVMCSAITRLFGYGHKTVLMVGTGMMNIGEFSFIIVAMGFQEKIFSSELYNLVILSAIITMLITPFAMSFSSFLYRWFSQKPWFARQLTSRVDPDFRVQAMEISRHAVICGYGDVGKRIAGVLEKQKFPYLVIELDPTVISQLRKRGIPCIYGDSSNPEILYHASLDKARVLICAIPDYAAEELTARNALKINPKLDIVARVHRDSDVELLKGVGVTELVLPFFEGSLEMIRHTLHRFGMSNTEIQYILNNLRYGQVGEKKEEEKK
jgi:CPA2 family monovalent cation:H+ antiporter-2